MTDRSNHHLSRREVVISGGSLILFGATASSQVAAQTSHIDISTRLAAHAGVEALPRELFANLTDALSPETREVLGREDTLPDDVSKRVLKGLYSGVLPAAGEDGDPTRIGFSNALKWEAIDATNNVISYCGGVPHFWADPPEVT